MPGGVAGDAEALPPRPYADTHLDLSISGSELRDVLLSAGGQHEIPVSVRNEQQIDNFFAQEEIVYRLSFSKSAGWQNLDQQASPYGFTIHINEGKTGWAISNFHEIGSSIYGHVAKHFIGATYAFRAERLTLARTPVNDETRLYPDAQNLANVILHLQTRSPARFARLNGYLRQIFPTILGISTKLEGGQANLLVWTIDAHQEYEQLSVDLASSGTGVGQAIAILYVVVNSDFPRVFVIDEPNSFLHPAAVRNLLQILKLEKHQYIISTHAAEIVSLSEPSTLHLVRWDGGQSVVETLAASNVRDVRRALSDIGVRLADVFGADEILWVEGQTEQECFPRLLLSKYESLPAGVAIVAVKNTGDFEGKRAKASLVWEIYNRLSGGNALIPPAVAFSFDREGRDEKEIVDLHRQSKSKVHFLPRRTYENYLIEVDALAAVISDEAAHPVSSSEISNWLHENGANPGYEAAEDWNGNLADEIWLRNIWASKLLSDLFATLSNATLEYRKTTHSIMLTEWLLLNKPDHLLPLVEYVSSLVDNSQSFRTMISNA